MKKLIPIAVVLLSGVAEAATVTVQHDTNFFSYASSKIVPMAQMAYASLPTASSHTGRHIWVTDAITPFTATGGEFFSDGTNWREVKSRVIATTDMRTFMLNCMEARWTGASDYMMAGYGDGFHPLGTTGIFGDLAVSINNGTVTSYSASGVNGITLSTSTSSSGAAWVNSSSSIVPATSDWFITGRRVKLDFTSTPTEKFYVFLGASGNAASVTGNHSGWLYDVDGVFTDHSSISGSATNNWIFWDQAAGVSTNYVGSGLVATNLAFHVISQVCNNSTNYYYYDSSATYTNNTAGPTVELIPSINKIGKTAGTTARTITIDWAYWAIRYNTSRSSAY